MILLVLYGLVEHYEYGELSETMIRDHIVVGIADVTLAEELQLDCRLTLETAIAKTCESETVVSCHMDYLLGMNFEIETDHKPLVPFLGRKLIDKLPLRIQRFRMRLMKFSYQISHVAGKNLVIADTLSRAPVAQISAVDQEFTKEVDTYVNMIVILLTSHRCNDPRHQVFTI